MNGWRYEWVQQLPPVVHRILVEMLTEEASQQETPPGSESGEMF